MWDKAVKFKMSPWQPLRARILSGKTMTC